MSSSATSVLIAIKSPLQALNAVEYYFHLSPPPAEVTALVFCSARKPEMRALLTRLLEFIPGIRIHPVGCVPSERGWWYSPREMLSARRFTKELQTACAPAKNPRTLVLGDYRSRECRQLATLYPHAPVVLLDDGSATHQIARYRLDPADPRLAPMFPRADLRALRLRLWAGIRAPFVDRVTYFTHYSITPRASDSVTPHTYAFWRSVWAKRRPAMRDEIFFLGMSHVEKKLTTLPRYLDALRKILAHYSGRPIVYRPHRDERPDKLDAVRALGFTILPPDITPIELILIESDTLPSEVSCIASSAIDNLAVIFQGTLPIRCFVPDAGYCSAAMNGHFQDIIRHHTAGGLRNVQTTALVDV